MSDIVFHHNEKIAARAANEGIPIAAIARIVEQPFEDVSALLRAAHSCGDIGEIPKADWPPAAKWSERLPSVARSANAEDVEFHCRRVFKLTALEAGFMMVILRCECADKEKLHNVIESQRRSRQALPDSSELTDPKMVDVIICKLRAKLEKAGFPKKTTLLTNWGQGYYFEAATKQKIFELIGGPYATGADPAHGH
jgi:hypothetical protein